MTIINHELKRGGISLIIWTVSIAFLIVTCVFMFPEMKNEMDNVSDMFASMGSFSGVRLLSSYCPAPSMKSQSLCC